MGLFVSKVPRALETKARLYGFELGDLLIIFLYLSVSNLVFGATKLKFPMVWVGTIALALVLRFSKQGRPDGYIQHLGEYWLSPSVYSAGASDVEFISYQSIAGRN